MIRTSILGYSRATRDGSLIDLLGARQRGGVEAQRAESAAAALRAEQRELARNLGVSEIPSGNFDLCDHVFDLARAFNIGGPSTGPTGSGLSTARWFGTHYHHLVPEVSDETRFELRFNRSRRAFQEALADGVRTRPALLGPVSFLLLSRNPEVGQAAPLTRLQELLPAYARLLRELAEAGAADVQIDEPFLPRATSTEVELAFRLAYEELSRETVRPRILVTSGFGSVVPQLHWLGQLPVEGLHIDLCSAPEQLEAVEHAWPASRDLSLGVIDGRNVWRSDVGALVDRLQPVVRSRGAERVVISTSCSLLHCPRDLDDAQDLDEELRSWLAFGTQKMGETVLVAQALSGNEQSVRDQISTASTALAGRRNNPRVHRAEVDERLGFFPTQSPAPARDANPGAWRDPLPVASLLAHALEGVVDTSQALVQTGPTELTRVPIVYGDVAWRPAAANLCRLPEETTVQGPSSFLRDAFVRADQPFGKTALEVALALADATVALAARDRAIVQLDDCALRDELDSCTDGVRLAESIDAFQLWTARVGAGSRVHPRLDGRTLAGVLAESVLRCRRVERARSEPEKGHS